MKSQLPTQSSQHGYTLIEVIVVVAMIGILTSIAFTSINLSSNNDAVRNSALDMRNAVRFEQEEALANQIALTGIYVGKNASFYGVLFEGTKGSNNFNLTAYDLVRVEKTKSFDCAGASQYCGTTVVSTTKFPSSTKPTVASANFAGSVVYPRAILFAEGSSIPIFKYTNITDGNVAFQSPSLTINFPGPNANYSIQVYNDTGRIDSVGLHP